MKTHWPFYFLLFGHGVRSLPRRNENRLSVVVHNHLYIRSEAYLEGMKTNATTCLSIALIGVRSLPRRNENLCLRFAYGFLCELSEAYLEGMKTKTATERTEGIPASEAYLEGMKTGGGGREAGRAGRSEAYLEGMKTLHKGTLCL